MRAALAILALLSIAAPLAAQEKQIVGGPLAPNARLSPGVRVGNLLYTSGQLGLVPMDSGGPGNIGDQTTRVMSRIKRIAEEGGTNMDQAVKCLVFIVDIADFAGMNAAYSPFFPRNPPARSTVVVAGLVNNAKVEIECIFAMPAGK